MLLVRHAGQDDGWGILGGAVEPGESPATAAIREAREEISVDIQLVRLLDVLGGSDYEVSYPNGDRVAYVTAVYEARIIKGSPLPGDGELSEIAWFAPRDLSGLPLSRFARALLRAGSTCPAPQARPAHRPKPAGGPKNPVRTAGDRCTIARWR
jgi:8-oxo-dGTP pyrophosphatase MutT (NUDIX family)